MTMTSTADNDASTPKPLPPRPPRLSPPLAQLPHRPQQLPLTSYPTCAAGCASSTVGCGPGTISHHRPSHHHRRRRCRRRPSSQQQPFFFFFFFKPQQRRSRRRRRRLQRLRPRRRARARAHAAERAGVGSDDAVSFPAGRRVRALPWCF